MHKRKRFGDLLVSMIEGEEGAGGGTGGQSGDPAPSGGQGGDNGDPAPNTDPAPNGEQGGSEGAGKGTEGGDDLTKWKGYARTWETRAGEHKTAAEKAAAERDAADARLKAVLKAAGAEGAEEEDPAKVAERLQAERDQSRAELRSHRIETAVGRAARAAGVDPDELLDRRSFAAEVDKLDPTSDSFADDAKSVLDAYLEKYPALKPAEGDGKGGKSKTPAPPSADMSGGGEQVRKGPQTPDDWRKARAERKRR